MALTDGLIRYYKLDGNSTDEVGGYNGTDTNVTYGTGKLNQCATGFVSGGTTRIELPTTGLPTGLSARSFMIGINQTDASSIQHCFGWGTDSTNQWFGIRVTSLGLVQVHIGGTTSIDTSFTNTANVWTQIIVTMNSSGDLNVYANGSNVLTTNRNTINTVLSKAFIGVRPSFTSSLRGSADEIGIWDRELTPTEVSQLHNGGNWLAYPLIPATSSFVPKMIIA